MIDLCRVRFLDTIRVDVGIENERRAFIAHTSFLTCRSRFFQKALRGGWKEAEERMVKLPDSEPAIFALYLHYVYRNEFAIIPHSSSSTPTDAATEPSAYSWRNSTSSLSSFKIPHPRTPS